jgi:hypothetical protein
VASADHELAFLLSLHGFEYRFAAGYRIKLEAQESERTSARPHGIKYSLTLHEPGGRRIYEIDNAHKAGSRRAFDHRHVYRGGKLVPYVFRGAAELLEDFYREAECILKERGASW